MQNNYAKLYNCLKIMTIFFIMISIFGVNCSADQQHGPYIDMKAQYQKNLFDFQTQFYSEEYLQNMTKQAETLQFGSLREKYLFIYSNHIDFCLEEIGDQFKTIVDAALMPIGVKLLGIGIAESIAVKTGILGALKIFGVAVGGLTVFPFLGLAGAAWIYNNYKTEQLKQICSTMMQKMQEEVQKQQKNLLEKVQQKHKIAKQKLKELLEIEKQFVQNNKKQQQISNKIQKTSSLAQTLSNYFQFFKLKDE